MKADRGSVNQWMPGGSKRIGGTPRWTRPSTNASCQPDKLDNSRVKTWGSASTLGVELAPPRRVSSNGREPRRASLAECGGYGRVRCWALLSTKWAFWVGPKRQWLPKNHSFQLPLQPVYNNLPCPVVSQEAAREWSIDSDASEYRGT